MKTIAELKKQEGGAVGQVVSSGLNRYVVVEETTDGINVMGLYGTFLGSDAHTQVFPVPDEEEAYVEDREKWKYDFRQRWDEIAVRFPAINGDKEEKSA